MFDFLEQGDILQEYNQIYYVRNAIVKSLGLPQHFIGMKNTNNTRAEITATMQEALNNIARDLLDRQGISVEYGTDIITVTMPPVTEFFNIDYNTNPS